jgi:glutathione S-transferase
VLLYDSAVSGNCYKVRLLLHQLGISFERRELDVVDRSNRPDVLGGLNPALRVPTIVLGDGRPLGESSAILWYFAEGTAYLPADRYERAQVLQWMCFEQYCLEPNVAVARFWAHLSPTPAPAGKLQALVEGGYAALDAMESHLASHAFFVGGAYTIADLALYAYTHVAPEGTFDLDRYPAIVKWLARVTEQPGHIAMGD